MQKIKKEFIFPGAASEEINKNIEKDWNIREGNEKHH
jgi:hypothetical protein